MAFSIAIGVAFRHSVGALHSAGVLHSARSSTCNFCSFSFKVPFTTRGCLAAKMSTPVEVHAQQPPEGSDHYDGLTTLLQELSALQSVSGILSWDEQVMMPPSSDNVRGQQKAALAGVTHEKASSSALNEAITACEARMNEFTPYQRAVVRDARRDYDHTARVSKELSQKLAEAETSGVAAWTKARKNSDWHSFAPHMRSGLDLAREYAQTTRPDMRPYDAAIDM